MMNYNEASLIINQIEHELGTMIERHLAFDHVTGEKYTIVSIVNDCVDLLKEIQRNIYAFSMSYSHEMNYIEFRPNYYFENIVMQYDMIWERIILLVGILDGLDERIIFDRNSIEPLYDLVKKNHPEGDDLGGMLRKIKGDHYNKTTKQKRNSNEHYISSHLKDELSDDIDVSNLLDYSCGFIKMDLREWKKISDELDSKSKKQMSEIVLFVQNKQEIYFDIFKILIPQLGIQFNDISMRSFKRVITRIPVIRKNYSEMASLLEKDYSMLRDDYRRVVEQVNRYVLFSNEKDVQIRYTLLIDAIHRAKELIRSINLYVCIVNYEISKCELFDFSKKQFEDCLYNDVLNENIYTYHAMMKNYSVFEKIAKYLLSKHDNKKEYICDDDFKNIYVTDVASILSQLKNKNPSVEMFLDLVASKEYLIYENIRNVEYHCLRQEYLYFDNYGEVVFSKMYIIYVLLKRLFPILRLLVNEEECIAHLAIEQKMYNA